MVERTYDWNGNTDIPMARPDLSDLEVAGQVRMLMRDQLNHEHVCTLARDRIMALSKENEKLRAQLAMSTDDGQGIGSWLANRRD